MNIKRFPLGTLWTNCYLIWDDSGNGFVVDPGGPAKEVEDFIRSHDIRLYWIILTHGHSDHIGGIADLRNISENGVAIHSEDAECLTSASKNLSTYIGEAVEMPSAEKLLKEGDRLKVGKMTLDVIHTPGRSLCGSCEKSIAKPIWASRGYTASPPRSSSPGHARGKLSSCQAARPVF